MRTYSELITLETFEERLSYLSLKDVPHESPRHMSESFYKSKAWLVTREDIIKRDFASDIGILGIDIFGPIYVHHINPLTETDILEQSYKCYDPENLICVSMRTHNIIHYGDKEEPYVERKPGDTKLW